MPTVIEPRGITKQANSVPDSNFVKVATMKLKKLQNQTKHNITNKEIGPDYLWATAIMLLSDVLDWTRFLHYFWLQEFIQQIT